MTEPASASTNAVGQRLVGAPSAHLALATTDGEMNAGSYGDWIEAMRERQTRQRDLSKWVANVADMATVCRQWLVFNPWAAEIVARFNSEPASVSLYVVIRDKETLSLAQRRIVSDMGLLLGGAFGVRVDACITSSRPENHSVILEPYAG